MFQKRPQLTPLPNPSRSQSVSNNEYGAVDAELVPGALRGYRSWRVLNDELVACNSPIAWPVGVMESEHVEYNSFVEVQISGRCKGHPQKDHACGIYAVHRLGNEDNRGWILGSIKAYGKTIVGTRGFRAGKAEIEALTLNPQGLNHHSRWSIKNFANETIYLAQSPDAQQQLWDMVDKMGEKYQVPVFRSAKALVEAFPPISVEHLLGDWEAEERRKQQEIHARLTTWRENGVQEIHAQIEEIEAHIRAVRRRRKW
jgi:hypothetical protein